MPDLTRPAFIDETSWEAASSGQKNDWATYARELAELAEDARFQRVAGRWMDEFCGVSAATLDPAEAGLPRADLLMAMREGARQPGIRIMQHLQAVAPKMWMRLLQELKNQRVRALMERPTPPEE